mmetsp:Transcript_46494/g.75892  ORF Transcript_46494/g.75892 Transcript_46494/m.75892 type:complete len:135 (-) Transcript_46494:592-996(-)
MQDIRDNGEHQLSVEGRARAKLVKNMIRDGRGCGLHVEHHATATIEGNEICRNVGPNLRVGDYAHVVANRNRIHDGRYGAIFLGQSTGYVEQNLIHSNQYGDMVSEDLATPLFRNNRTTPYRIPEEPPTPPPAT